MLNKRLSSYDNIKRKNDINGGEWVRGGMDFEIMRAVGRFFLHPAVYVFLISSIFVGYLRMLRERKDFSFKVYDIWFELRTALFAGIGYGLVVSIITIGLGLVVSKASLWAILLWTLLFGLTAMYRYLSAAYTFSIAIVCVLLSSKLPVSFLQLGKVKRIQLCPLLFC